MKKTLIFLALVVSTTTYAQTITPDARLSKIYSVEELEEISSDQEKLEILNYYLDHGFSVTPFPEGKRGTFECNFIELPEGSFDLSDLNIKPSENHQYFEDAGKGLILNVYGTKTLEYLIKKENVSK